MGLFIFRCLMGVKFIQGDCRKILITLPSESVHCVVTSPPYWGLRDYGIADQLGLEPTPEAYTEELVKIFREVRRVLRADGTVWLNLGDSYSGSGKGGNPDGGKQATNKGSQSIGVLYGKTGNTARQAAVTNVSRRLTSDLGFPAKQLLGIPWRVAFALQADGWWLRQDIIWSKPNPMPESVTDRPTKAHEYIFLLAKSEQYFYDAEAIKEQSVMKPQARLTPRDFVTGKDAQRSGHRRPNYRTRCDAEQENAIRNKRSVWEVATKPYKAAHFATFPPKLIVPCIKAGCPPNGTVLDPFGGSGTTGHVAAGLGRSAILIDLNPEYKRMASHRIGKLFQDDAVDVVPMKAQHKRRRLLLDV
jgi:DNA modification methylase